MENWAVLSGLDLDMQVVIFLLMLPVVATIAGIARYIVGVKSLGIYAPIVLTFSLYVLGLNGKYGNYSDIGAGILYGSVALSVVVVASFFGSALTRKARMHYFPKISISLSLVSLALLGLVVLSSYAGIAGFTSTNLLALVLIATVSEQFTSTMAKKNFKTAFLTTIETLAISAFSFALIAWPSFQDFILTYPYLVLLTFVLNYYIGKYRGLRINEYFRFNKILNSPEVEEN